ncbi:FTSZ1 [Scenedesmus sp. PABB004]|nr:FTSZ1 [Scenedesmus sp. PABB004]
MQASRSLSAGGARHPAAHSSVRQRTARPCLCAAPPGGGLPVALKRSLSVLCRMVHGGGGDGEELAPREEEPLAAAPAPAPAAPPADVAGAPPAPAGASAISAAAAAAYLAQAEANRNGHALIKVVGCGGGGGNAIARMIATGLQNVEFWAVNTDKQSLDANICPNKLQIGTALTRGLGTGGKPALGEQAAQESAAELAGVAAGADMLFVTAGMGGGTGTGAAPVIARLAKDAGILTVGVVTYPFSFEGRRRAGQAVEGIETLRRNVDTLIVIPNDKLLDAVSGTSTSLTDAFALADTVLRQARWAQGAGRAAPPRSPAHAHAPTRAASRRSSRRARQGVGGISDMITIPGLINVDFADIKAVMRNSGTAMLGVGYGSGPDRALQARRRTALPARAAAQLLRPPRLAAERERAPTAAARGAGPANLTLAEVNTISEVVTGLAGDPSSNIIFGAVVDESCPPDDVQARPAQRALAGRPGARRRAALCPARCARPPCALRARHPTAAARSQVTIIATGFSQTFEAELLGTRGDVAAGAPRRQRGGAAPAAAAAGDAGDEQQLGGWLPGSSRQTLL